MMVYVCVSQADLSLREGSGHFFVNTSLKGVAEVTFQGAVGTAQVGRLTHRKPRDSERQHYSG